jgi:Xaa-Pro aminopeptidase
MVRLPRAAVLRFVLAVVFAAAAATAAGAQPLFTSAFPPAEFAAHRQKLIAAIGDGVAVLQGAAETGTYVAFRQSNHFYYLTGVEVPRAIVVIDGKAKTTTLFLPPRDERWERAEGPILVPGDEAARVTGIASVRPRDDFAAVVDALGRDGRTIYTPHRGESLAEATVDSVLRHQRLSQADPWDGRGSREDIFIAKLKAKAPQAKIEDLDPIVDKLRLIKTPREIAAIREATRVSMLGILEGMKTARPGIKERDIAAVANFEFTRNGSQNPAYFALVAAGKNAHYPHYHASQATLRDGDLVLFDYAPDIDYYTSDVTRVFPANGHFTPWQREIYTVYLRCYRALMSELKPGRTARQVFDAAVVKMQAVVDGTTFTDPKIEDAAKRFVALFGPDRRSTRVGHFVGMEVHDVDPDGDAGDVLAPGMVLTIAPAITIPDERVYVRLEDMILITETGYENMSESLPYEIADIEAAMKAPGIDERAAPSAHSAKPVRPPATTPRSQQEPQP